jgi:hypothetical protein
VGREPLQGNHPDQNAYPPKNIPFTVHYLHLFIPKPFAKVCDILETTGQKFNVPAIFIHELRESFKDSACKLHGLHELFNNSMIQK